MVLAIFHDCGFVGASPFHEEWLTDVCVIRLPWHFCGEESKEKKL